mmetsp:Transcript_11470/g.20715  ORF Transcript_11470/g.20715 Transcript_11470/m.20715 type:complete len:209 (-) Transcript_11470:1545-2171(-)
MTRAIGTSPPLAGLAQWLTMVTGSLMRSQGRTASSSMSPARGLPATHAARASSAESCRRWRISRWSLTNFRNSPTRHHPCTPEATGCCSTVPFHCTIYTAPPLGRALIAESGPFGPSLAHLGRVWPIPAQFGRFGIDSALFSRTVDPRLRQRGGLVTQMGRKMSRHTPAHQQTCMQGGRAGMGDIRRVQSRRFLFLPPCPMHSFGHST